MRRRAVGNYFKVISWGAYWNRRRGLEVQIEIWIMTAVYPDGVSSRAIHEVFCLLHLLSLLAGKFRYGIQKQVTMNAYQPFSVHLTSVNVNYLLQLFQCHYTTYGEKYFYGWTQKTYWKPQPEHTVLTQTQNMELLNRVRYITMDLISSSLEPLSGHNCKESF
jgi:hypothetical protein